MPNHQLPPKASPDFIDAEDHQREVQRLLGYCVLRLQHYERLLKALVAHHQLAGPADSLEKIRAENVEATANATLGGLIGKIVRGYLLVTGEEAKVLAINESAPHIAMGFRSNLEMCGEDYERTRDSLKDFVEMRNRLVHHFIEDFDLGQLDGCAAARDYLLTCSACIESHYAQLRSWVEHMEQARRLAASFVNSAVFHELVVNGIAPDGKIDWSFAGCVSVLREAIGRLAVDGWTSLDKAVKWIRVEHPEQTPEKYHCSSWSQVLAESRQFELRYRKEDGRKRAWYRERPSNGGVPKLTPTATPH